MRDTLADTVRQNRELTRRIEDLERQLRERPAPAPPVEVVADPAEIRALRLKLEQAQEVVREKNLELARAELCTKLSYCAIRTMRSS